MQPDPYAELRDLRATIGRLSRENIELTRQTAPLMRRIADLEEFVHFVAGSRPRLDGSCSMCGERAAPEGEPEQHHRSCLIQQARAMLAKVN